MGSAQRGPGERKPMETKRKVVGKAEENEDQDTDCLLF